MLCRAAKELPGAAKAGRSLIGLYARSALKCSLDECPNVVGVALRWLLGNNHPTWHSSQYARVRERVEQDGASPWTILTKLAAGEIEIRHTAQLVKRFNNIHAELAALAVASDLNKFIKTWLPANPKTQLLAESVVRAREGATTTQELFENLYAAITQPEIPLEVTEVRVMSLHKSKGLSSPYVFIVGCVEGLLPARPDEHLSPVEQQAKIQEDRRLFYVGITRVKADPPNRTGYLAITYAQTMEAAAAHRSQITPTKTVRGVAHLQSSRFVGEMAPHAPVAQFNRPL